MPVLFIVLIVVGIIVFGLSFLGAALKFLLFIGLIIVVIGVVGYIFRAVTSRKG